MVEERVSCGEGTPCLDDQCLPDHCVNNRRDSAETAVDCGGPCAPCIPCTVDADCTEHGTDFCDNAVGFCSQRCRDIGDCNLLADEFCRDDGRCSSHSFITKWKITEPDTTIELPYTFVKGYSRCNFRVLWGDEYKGANIHLVEPITGCTTAENRKHTYTMPGDYTVRIVGTYDGWGAVRKARSVCRR